MPAAIIVGQPHPFLADRQVSEGALLMISPDYLGICSILDHPTPHEVREHHQPMRIGLVPAGDHTFFVIMKLGTLNWADMPFALRVDHPLLPPREGNAGYWWHCELVDLTTRIVLAMHAFTVTPAFSMLLERQISKLRRNLPTFTPEKHRAEIADFYRRYPDQNQMASAAIIIERAGMAFPQ